MSDRRQQHASITVDGSQYWDGRLWRTNQRLEQISPILAPIAHEIASRKAMTSPPSPPTAEPMTEAQLEACRKFYSGEFAPRELAESAWFASGKSFIATIDSLRAELREAREALEPFAKVGGIYPGLEDNARISMRRVNSDKSTDVLLGDLRRAARAIAGKENKDE